MQVSDVVFGFVCFEMVFIFDVSFYLEVGCVCYKLLSY